MCNTTADFEDKPIQKKPKQLTKQYSSAWEKYSVFKDWLAPSKKGDRCFYCKLCKRDYDGDIIAIKLHSSTRRHVGQSAAETPPELLDLTDRNFNETAGKYFKNIYPILV